jgi:hypothetical protein
LPVAFSGRDLATAGWVEEVLAAFEEARLFWEDGVRRSAEV